MLHADVLADIAAHGGDAAELLAHARSSRLALTQALKDLGYAKLGARKKLEQAQATRQAVLRGGSAKGRGASKSSYPEKLSLGGGKKKKKR